MSNCIVLTANKNYIEYAEFVAWQLRQAVEDAGSIFIATADGTSRDLRHQVAELMKIKVSDFLLDLPSNARLQNYAYWRIDAINNLVQNFDKVLYLDCDLFVSGSCILDIFKIDLHDSPIAAVRDVHQSIRPERFAREFRDLKLINAPYFNSGVLLIDSNAFREQEIFSRINEIAKQTPNVLSAHDQSLLNIACYQNWHELSPVWNWQYSRRNKFITPHIDLELIHFAGPHKPWIDPKHELPQFVRETFSRFRKSRGNSNPTHSTNDFFDYTSALKNYFYKNAYKRWLNRFPNKLCGRPVASN